jgi:predicted transcriptional regulator
MCYVCITKLKDMLNVRLSDDTEKELVRYCLDEGMSKSMVVKEALVAYLAQRRKTRSAFEAGADLFGQEGSGSTDNSVSYKNKIKIKLHAKYAR